MQVDLCVGLFLIFYLGYTQLITKETKLMELNQYFDPELFNLIDSITKSRNSHKHSSSALYKDLRTARIRASQ